MLSAIGRTSLPAAMSSWTTVVVASMTPLPNRVASSRSPAARRGPSTTPMPSRPTAARNVVHGGQFQASSTTSRSRRVAPARLPSGQSCWRHTGNISSRTVSRSTTLVPSSSNCPQAMVRSKLDANVATPSASMMIISVPGLAERNRSSRGISQPDANIGGTSNRSLLPREGFRSCSTAEVIWVKASARPLSRRLPSAVRHRPRPSRFSSAIPISSSRLLIWRLTALGVTDNSEAAAVTDRSRAKESESAQGIERR